jgi:hypothetical protein
MALLVPDEGMTRIFTYAFNAALPATYKLHLFNTTHACITTSVLADFDGHECTGDGYTEQVVTLSSTTFGTAAGVTTATFSEETFTFTSGDNIEGYYVEDVTTTPVLLWAEKFADSPHVIPAGGGTQKVTLKITGTSA